jgi:hypothetical protein
MIGFCNYVPRIMNNTDLCPGSGGSYVTDELLLLVNADIAFSSDSAMVTAFICGNFGILCDLGVNLKFPSDKLHIDVNFEFIPWLC